MITTQVTGFLGKDATIKQVNENFSVVQFSIASTEKVNNEDVTTWVNCSLSGRDKLAPYLKKGIKVAVSGKLTIKKLKENDVAFLKVYDLDFMSSKQDKENEPESNESDDRGDEMPF